MAKHMVICMSCGKRFDASRGGYYFKSQRRYMCPKCGKAHNREVKEEQADYREARTGMRQTAGAMVAKIAIGVICVIACLSGPMEIGARLLGIIVGLALIAWGLLPWLLPRLKERKQTEAAAAAAQAEAERLANLPKVCPACGAQTKGDRCEYCGTPLDGEP